MRKSDRNQKNVVAHHRHRDRFFQQNEQWFFQTREGTRGPFETRQHSSTIRCTLRDMSRVKSVLAVHFVLALAPLGMPLVPLDMRFLSMLWVLASVPLSQLMLLSIYLGMTVGKLKNKFLVATAAVLFLGIWPAMGEYLMATDRSTASFGTSYLRLLGMDAGLLVVLSLVLERRLRGGLEAGVA